MSEPMYRVKQRPDLATVAGKFMVVSQFAEPKRYDKDTHEFVYLSFNELDEEWWRLASPSVFDEKRIHWGESTWLINADGTLSFSGANYDSSG